MTRFARAKGSKASNQRIPEEATPWCELKKKASEVFPPSELKKHEEETNWKEVINNDKKLENNLNSVWCDFGVDDNEKKVNSCNKKRILVIDSNEGNFHELKDINCKREKIKKHKGNLQESKLSDVESGTSNEIKFKRKKRKRNLEESKLINNETGLSNESNVKSNKIKKNKRNKLECVITSQGDSLSPQENSFQEKDSSPSVATNDHGEKIPRFKGSENWSVTGKQFKKTAFQATPHTRRKLDQGNQTVDINGQIVILTRLDGFYIQKEDAERIKQLEKDLLKRGVSKEEIRAVVKKERRNAEKSLARLKKKVCFHCRRGGHILSSCPKLSEGGSAGSGICYKCGSTEHSHFECRVSTNYKFAVCFICNEEGHIARECPDNPRGLYPHGGACKLCGDVTHLKKDCPKASKKEKITLDLISDDIEALPDPENNVTDSSPPKKKKKTIKFK